MTKETNIKGQKERRNDIYRDVILNSAGSVHFLNKFNNGGPIIFLSNQIHEGKKNLKYNSVDFIIGKLLNRNERLINYEKRDYINLYVIGSFRNEFIPTLKVAQALSDFYLEMKVMPNIITISKKEFLDNLKFSIAKIRLGILIYDRERNLH